jgi:hypothetical protein
VHTVTDRRDGCLETDGPTVLGGIETVYTRPPTTTKPKVGDRILARLSFRPEGLIPVTVRKMAAGVLTVAVPYVDAEGEFEETVTLSAITYLAAPMTPVEFSSLKAGAKLMLYSQPPACDAAFYQPIEIRGTPKRCYLVQRVGEAFGRVAAQLIPESAL